MELSLRELQDILGRRVKQIDESSKLKAVERQIAIEDSQVICNLSKQMIASAKVQLQAKQIGTSLNGVIE